MNASWKLHQSCKVSSWPGFNADEEEEVQSGQQQLAIRPADMSFEQAMRHYMDEIARTSKDTNSQLQTLDNRYAILQNLLCISFIVTRRHESSRKVS